MSEGLLASRQILVVDDDAQIRRMVKQALELAGAEVRVAAGGPEALALAKEAVPELVLLDLGMPEMDGWDVLRALREEGTTAFVPVALLTGANDCDSYERARKLEVAAFISKPFRLAELTGLCRRVLESRFEAASERLRTLKVLDRSGRELGDGVVLDRDDNGAMLELERPLPSAESVSLVDEDGVRVAAEVRWHRVAGQRFHVGLRILK